MQVLSLLWGTVLLRPYVFLFLGCYLALAGRHLGWRRTLAFLVGGYLLAWTSEVASIHTGFPYGLYIYIPATQSKELWVGGVPFMDSLSYVFLSYASFCLAQLWLSGRQTQAGTAGTRMPLPAWTVIPLGALLFVTLDVVIDPLTLRGYRWFLGQIYGYPEYGIYFGVPLSNFAGWLLVGLALQTVLFRLQDRPPAWLRGSEAQKRRPADWYGGAALYFAVLLFNTTMTFVIGEFVLGAIAVGVVLTLGGLTWLTQVRRRPTRPAGS